MQQYIEPQELYLLSAEEALKHIRTHGATQEQLEKLRLIHGNTFRWVKKS